MEKEYPDFVGFDWDQGNLNKNQKHGLEYTECEQIKTEDEERDFWDKNSPLDFFNVESAKQGSFPNLKPSLKSVSIRLPQSMIDDLKVLANKRDIP